MKTALTIAGSDSSGGAGIQADIKTMTANGVFAMSAITALTAQNTTGVTDIFETTPRFLAEQLDAIFTDIYPDAVKIGMVSSAELIDTIAEKLHAYEAKHIVVDPVMVATSGSKLLRDDAVQALTAKLLPMAEVLTPNIPEAEILSGMTISDAAGMEAAAKAISEKYGCAVLCKGGRVMKFSALVVVGDGKGTVGYGLGKAAEVSEAILKGIANAKKNLHKVTLSGTTIPHEVIGIYGAGSVLMKPASVGTGVIAGGAVRAVMEAVGITNIRTKCLRSNNPQNVVKATMQGLLSLRGPEEVARIRGKSVEEIIG